jgi:membrane-bound lytic murein transglycosylase D
MKQLMASQRNTTLLLRGALALGALPLLAALAGCPSDTSVATPGQAPANATAPAVTAAQQQQPAPTPQQLQQQAAAALAEKQHAKKVQDTIDRAESNYRSGVENYNNNHLDAARLDFDAAVDGMLSSGLDLKNDPQMSDEFDHLLSAINSLEMVALKQGNGFSPKVEAAPIDIAANEETFPVDPNLTSRATAELKTTTSDFPLVVNDEVAFWISYFTNSNAGHAHLVASLRRAGKYKEMIQRILREQGVPQDLIYQAITESGFQPQVVNARSGAGGMWQFMPFASSYGLVRNGYFDERFDPEKSTIAYAKYMKSLYDQFGDWYLAMAAYDWGPGRVQHVVSRTGYADYWEMSRHGNLPAETKAYIPGVIASIIMAHNPQQYGLSDLVPDPPVLSDTVTTSYAIDLRLVADLTDSTVADIVVLNPALLRLSTPRDIPYDLHVPHGTHDEFLDRLKDIPEENRASWRFHVVKDGETLDQIATSLHAKTAEVAEFNEVTPSQPLKAGDELIVPVASVSSVASGVQRYTPGHRDTLITIADRFGVTVEQLRAWNHLASNRIVPGHSLYVTEPIRLAPGMRSSRGRAKSTSTRNRTTRTTGRTSYRTTVSPSRSTSSHAHAPSKTSTKKNTHVVKHRAH